VQVPLRLLSDLARLASAALNEAHEGGSAAPGIHSSKFSPRASSAEPEMEWWRVSVNPEIIRAGPVSALTAGTIREGSNRARPLGCAVNLTEIQGFPLGLDDDRFLHGRLRGRRDGGMLAFADVSPLDRTSGSFFTPSSAVLASRRCCSPTLINRDSTDLRSSAHWMTFSEVDTISLFLGHCEEWQTQARKLAGVARVVLPASAGLTPPGVAGIHDLRGGKLG